MCSLQPGQSIGKNNKLKKIEGEIQELTKSPLYEYRKENQYLPVIGEGDLDARLMFIGEAPGKQEALSGRPFVGAAGRVLDELLESIHLDREQVYITNIVKDRPPGNRDPKQDEILLYAPFLLRQIDIIQPRVIATLGRFAMDFILEQFDLPQLGRKIGELHGKPLTAEASYGKITVIPLYHPAVALYRADRKETLAADFRALSEYS